MKVELEEAVKDLGFAHTVILRPGMLIGKRQGGRSGENVAGAVANFMGAVSKGFLKNSWAQDAVVVARAAVAAGIQCISEEKKDPVWQVDQAEIVRLGKKG